MTNIPFINSVLPHADQANDLFIGNDQTDFVQSLLSQLSPKDYIIYNLLLYRYGSDENIFDIALHKLEDEKKRIRNKFNELLIEQSDKWGDFEYRSERVHIMDEMQQLFEMGNSLSQAKLCSREITKWYKVEGDLEQMYTRAMDMIDEGKVILEVGFMFWEGKSTTYKW